MALQYALIPLLAWTLCLILDLPRQSRRRGSFWLDAVPRARHPTSSPYFAKADVPLSVVMTLISTLLAPWPLLPWWNSWPDSG